MMWAALMKQARVFKYGLIALLAGVLVVGHGILLYRLSSQITRAIGLGLILLVLLKHVGLLGSIHAFLKRRSGGST
jgi:hypothetical protein